MLFSSLTFSLLLSLAVLTVGAYNCRYTLQSGSGPSRTYDLSGLDTTYVSSSRQLVSFCNPTGKTKCGSETTLEGVFVCMTNTTDYKETLVGADKYSRNIGLSKTGDGMRMTLQGAGQCPQGTNYMAILDLHCDPRFPGVQITEVDNQGCTFTFRIASDRVCDPVVPITPAQDKSKINMMMVMTGVLFIGGCLLCCVAIAARRRRLAMQRQLQNEFELSPMREDNSYEVNDTISQEQPQPVYINTLPPQQVINTMPPQHLVTAVPAHLVHTNPQLIHTVQPQTQFVPFHMAYIQPPQYYIPPQDGNGQ